MTIQTDRKKDRAQKFLNFSLRMKRIKFSNFYLNIISQFLYNSSQKYIVLMDINSRQMRLSNWSINLRPIISSSSRKITYSNNNNHNINFNNNNYNKITIIISSLIKMIINFHHFIKIKSGNHHSSSCSSNSSIRSSFISRVCLYFSKICHSHSKIRNSYRDNYQINSRKSSLSSRNNNKYQSYIIVASFNNKRND